ncbi:MAG: hypothetical protein ACI9BD_000201 [Candidatus Marinamargulisbacteria bacterium]|jgi:hypothetical protein
MAEPIVTTNIPFSRAHVELVLNNKVQTIYDFTYGEYLAQRTFFDELSRVQSDLVSKGEVTLNTGQTAKLDSVGGMLAIQIYMETLESSRQTMSGLAKLGMNIENKIWKQL